MPICGLLTRLFTQTRAQQPHLFLSFSFVLQDLSGGDYQASC